MCLAHFLISACIFVWVCVCGLVCVSINARVCVCVQCFSSRVSVCSPVITDKQSGRIITLPPSPPHFHCALPFCLSLCDDSAVCWSVLLLVSRHIVYPLTRPCVLPLPPPIFLFSQSSHPVSTDASWVRLSALLPACTRKQRPSPDNNSG